MTIEPTTDPEVIRKLTGETILMPAELWLNKEGVTVLVAKVDNEPKIMALILEKGVTQCPEVHLQAPRPFPNAVKACDGFREWIKVNRPWKSIWSYTCGERELQFAKYLGFKHAFDHDGLAYLVLNLK